MNKRSIIFSVITVAFFALQCFLSPLSAHRWEVRALDNDDDEDDYDGYYDERLHIPDSILAKWTPEQLDAYADSVLALVPQDSIILELVPIYGETPDSIQSHIDSICREIYLRDSLALAQIRFQEWFDSLSKKEQKKWTYENVTIPAKIHRRDSLNKVQEEKKAYRDSVIKDTPRILSTSFIPDSLWYKRILLMTQDKYTGEFKNEKLDTSFNYWYSEYPFYRKDVNATWLGVAGSPVQLYDATKREEERNVVFFTPHRAWTYDASSIPTYNSKTPHTELGYWGTPFNQNDEEEINLRFLTTQNITPALNLTLELNKYGSGGKLQNQNTSAYHLGASTNYLGKRYSLHAGWMHDRIAASENGGLAHLEEIRDTTLKSRELSVNLAKAASEVKREMIFLNHSLRIPFGKDSVMTTAFIGHTTEWALYKRNYGDNITDRYGRAFYRDVFNINPSKSLDTLGVMKLDNRIYLKLQPWKEDFFISKITAGLGDKLVRYISPEFDSNNALTSRKVYQNSLYAYADVNGMVGKYFNWDAMGRITFLGTEVGDFEVKANAQFNFYPFRKDRKSPVSINAHFITDLTTPDYYQQKILLNHFSWDNNFVKTSRTKVSGSLNIPRWKLDLEAAYQVRANEVYFDSLGISRQSATPVNIISASLHKEFVLWKFHLDNRVLVQYSSNNDVIPVPLVALNLRYFLQFDVVKNVMQMQIGANALFNTKWYLPSYNPELGVFYNQKDISLGNCPVIDVFVNAQWKKACIFIKMENIAEGAPLKKGKDYFTAKGYIHSQRTFKVGIMWPFYVNPKKIKSQDHDHEGHNH